MKKRNCYLALALVISMVLVALVGAYIKYVVLRPLELYQDRNIIELPFLLMSDSGMRMTIREAMDPTDPPENTHPDDTIPDTSVPPDSTAGTDDPTEETTEPGTDPTTNPPTNPPTDPPDTNPPATNPPQTDPPKVDPNFEFTGPAVDWSWFDDALFIGDSRTVGLRDYARSGDADYFCNVGMSSFNVLNSKSSDEDFPEQTLEHLLSSKTYGKVFINLGINECGYSISSFIKAYKKVVDTVRQAQPDAIIILHGIMNVGKKYASGKAYFSPEHLADINDEILAFANGSDIFYIDANYVFSDSDGYLLSTVSGDGCHLYAKYDKVWADWMRYAMASFGF